MEENMIGTGTNLKLVEEKPEYTELLRTLTSNRFLDISGKSLEFLKWFSSYFYKSDWAYAFKIKKNPPPFLLSYHPLSMIKKILEFNSRIDIQAVIEEGYGYHIKFDFDIEEKKLFLGEINNKYFFLPIFHNPEIDSIYYDEKVTPTAGFIFYNSRGFLKEPMLYYEDFKNLVSISNILYRDILSESITPFSVLFLKEGIRYLEEENASPIIIQDFFLRALYAGRTQWNWDILGNTLIEIMEKADLQNNNHGFFRRELEKFLKDLLNELLKVQKFTETFIKEYRNTGDANIPLSTALEENYNKYASDDLKFLHHTRNFLKDFRVEYLNLSQVGAVTPQEVMAKSKSNKFLEQEVSTLCQKVLEINRILFEYQP
jgi:hypothetical protein